MGTARRIAAVPRPTVPRWPTAVWQRALRYRLGAGRALHGTRIAERGCVTAVQAGVRGRFVIAMLIGRRLHLRYRQRKAHDPRR
ncbi:hypothetical protein XAP412_1310027 [Xanthomonas phaseoli pv. phaseoli]|uniref:Uncharacterized protein n=1 Tax=Xanthomonas campestris pv. phaseoli TaxID=317013 RepID=A0AB38DWZ7_XANCH|nr:hypothetical protein XAP6984_1330032 [Xanthomonas phaseoli pv. phaseoli]SON79832.1 hypothetical protein XAP412_1310027 [Xanthomonas phaseoli pv. phaseoli]SON82952.1 hypothetical protein XAP7430_1310033 [Xanthomonas phaseoli pv. phaseoli]SOO31562.1 hypothetical protein XAP6164_5650004 [Xanthomonas phaseoli pv. phaseoli]